MPRIPDAELERLKREVSIEALARARGIELAPPVKRQAGDAELLSQVVGFYHETLKQSPEALAYLEKRGLKSPEMIERFKLGYANRTLGYRLPASNRQAGAEMRGRLQTLGILRDTGHEHFNGSLVIPVFSLQGEVLGRSLDELPPQTRRLLLLIDGRVSEECRRLKIERCDFRFSRKDVRGWCEWGSTQLKVHLHRLEDLEYLLVHRGGRGQSFVYELVFERGADDRPVLAGLIDVYDLNRSALAGDKSGSSRPQAGGMSAPGRMHPTSITTALGAQHAAAEA